MLHLTRDKVRDWYISCNKLLQPTFPDRMRCLLCCLVHLCTISMVFSTNLTICTADVTKHPNWMLLEHTKCGNTNSDRIIGGKNASLGAYPWIARIGYSGPSTDGKLSFRCGGSLINQLYVVTAAHCVTNLPDSLKVSGIRVGEHNTLTDPDCENGYCAKPVQDFLPETIIIHEDYDKPLYRNDIAIIRLNKPAIYDEHVRPICVMSGQLLAKDFVGEMAEVAGWGIYDINDPKPSTILQTVKLPIVDTNRCKMSFRSYADIGDKQMCVGGVLGEDSCGGDSGGPLMKVMSQGGPPRYYFVGVVSFGAKNCGGSSTPAVYSKITMYITWILDHISA